MISLYYQRLEPWNPNFNIATPQWIIYTDKVINFFNEMMKRKYPSEVKGLKKPFALIVLEILKAFFNLFSKYVSIEIKEIFQTS